MTPAVRQLESLGIVHRTVSYDHDASADSYGAEAAEALGLDPGAVFKTLVARTDGGLVVACVSVADRLDLRALARAAGVKRAEMADVADAERSSGYVVGGISPLGQRRRLPTFLDETIELSDEVFVSGGRRGLEIAIAPAALIEALDATVAPVARH